MKHYNALRQNASEHAARFAALHDVLRRESARIAMLRWPKVPQRTFHVAPDVSFDDAKLDFAMQLRAVKWASP